MKLKLLIFTLFICGCKQKAFAQCFFEGKVVNNKTKKPIISATIEILNKNFGIYTNEKGEFTISFKCSNQDTIIFSSIGYKSLKISINILNSTRVIELEENPLTLIPITVGIKDSNKTLNNFVNCSTEYLIANDSTFQVAQSYYSPFKMSLLKKIKICKLRGSSSFKLKIYGYDSLTKKPSKIIADTLISQIAKQRKVSINIEALNIKIASKKFFICIEWILSNQNRYYQKWKINGMLTKNNVYKPEICLKEKDIESETVILFKNTNEDWFMSDYYNSKTLLISVDIERIE